MAHYESALSELAERLAGTDASLSTSLADILTVALQELIEAELTARIGAEPGERTAARTTQRNGHRTKLLSTQAGDVELGIPKLRKGSFFPELLEPRRRIDKALWAVIMTAYITGTSTRKVDELVKALGCDTGISKSSVSRICKASMTTSPCCIPAGWITCRLCTCGWTRPTCTPRAWPGRLQSGRDRHRAAR
jgi:putative transposase